MNCEHFNFKANVNVARIEHTDNQPMTFSADITINCADCGEKFHFIGVDYGYSPLQPMLSANGLEMRAPIRPGESFVFAGYDKSKIKIIESKI